MSVIYQFSVYINAAFFCDLRKGNLETEKQRDGRNLTGSREAKNAAGFQVPCEKQRSPVSRSPKQAWHIARCEFMRSRSFAANSYKFAG